MCISSCTNLLDAKPFRGRTTSTAHNFEWSKYVSALFSFDGLGKCPFGLAIERNKALQVVEVVLIRIWEESGWEGRSLQKKSQGIMSFLMSILMSFARTEAFLMSISMRNCWLRVYSRGITFHVDTGPPFPHELTRNSVFHEDLVRLFHEKREFLVKKTSWGPREKLNFFMSALEGKVDQYPCE